ncbi:MAG: flotillin family protein, partial [Clostridia bacterium]|nr:flotillin family protein [Clostridia bacterium]
VKKAAEIARADAERDIALARAVAAKEANEGQVAADTSIAENNNKLALRRSALKAEADKAAVDAEAAGKIQAQIQEKTLRERQADAEIAAQEKAIIRTDKEVEVQKRRLSADIREKADADKYAANARADAQKYAAEQEAMAARIRRQNEADASLYETQKEADARKAAAEAARFAAEQEAEGIRAKGEAEAQAIQARALAEAEGIEKKAQAQNLMGDASKLEMLYNVLPDVAKALASSLNGVESLTMYGTDANSEYIGKITQAMNGFLKAMADGTGIRLGAGLAGAIPGLTTGAAKAEEPPKTEAAPEAK